MIPKELDETDIKIINALKKNGRISMTNLGRQVYLTSQAVKNRLERLYGQCELPCLRLRRPRYF